MTRRALRAAKTRVASGDHVGRDAALPVGRPGQRDEARFTGDGVIHLDRIAHGEDVGIGRAHLVVDANAAAFADLQAGRAREVGVGTHPEREDHDVGRIHLPGLRAHAQRAFTALFERGHAVVELNANAVPNEVIFHRPRHVLVERPQHLVGHLDERDVEAPVHQVLRALHADEAAANDDRARLRPHRLEARVLVHAGQEQGAALEPLADRARIGHRP